jgi:hypothetical protein
MFNQEIASYFASPAMDIIKADDTGPLSVSK